jgi:hypothetical protein
MTEWQTWIRALEDKFGALQAVADALGTPLSTLSDLKQGRSRSPRGDLALKLDALYRARCRNAPRRDGGDETVLVRADE